MSHISSRVFKKRIFFFNSIASISHSVFAVALHYAHTTVCFRGSPQEYLGRSAYVMQCQSHLARIMVHHGWKMNRIRKLSSWVVLVIGTFVGFDLWVQRYLVVVLWLYEGIFFFTLSGGSILHQKVSEPNHLVCICVCVVCVFVCLC